MTNNDGTVIGEDATVRGTLDTVYTAWADNDADAFVAEYAHDATAVLPGAYLCNREAIRAAMVASFAGPLKGSKAVHDVQTIRFIGDDMAIVISKGAVVPAERTEPDEDSRSLETWVLTKRTGAWRIQAFHNCPLNVA